MAHIRKLIRDNVVTSLTGLTSTGSNVYASRVYPLAPNKLPGLAIFTNSEDIAYRTVNPPRTLIRTMTVNVEIYVKAVTTFDDDLDTVIAEVEAALYTDITRGGYAEDTKISSIDVQFSGDGDQPVAGARLDVEVTYFTTEGSPTN